jgi:hypothetical protein
MNHLNRKLSSYPVYFEWSDAVDLHHVALGDGKMMHAFGHYEVGASWHILAGIFIELVAGSNAKGSREDPILRDGQD